MRKIALMIQYVRTIDEAANYWKDEIKAGLSNGKYIEVSRFKVA
jgi:hypothetical protein